MNTITFNIRIPTDEGFLGRECKERECSKYFRIHSDSIKDKMHCPYCGKLFDNDDLFTKDQTNYLRKVSQEKARKYMLDQADKMFSDLERSFRSSKYVTVKRRPIRYRERLIQPYYREAKVDTELTCPKCLFVFQVYGIFGFCPGCRTEDMLLYETNLSIIRNEIKDSTDQQRALRHAYNDLVSTFEMFCSKKARNIASEKPSFQELYPTRRFFKKHMNMDIFSNLSKEHMLHLRRAFQKRHVYQHAHGIINERYTKYISEDAKLIGKKADLTLDEFENAAKALRDVVKSLINSS